MRTVCTKCSQIVDVDEGFIGSTVICPHCGDEFFVKPRNKVVSGVKHISPVKQEENHDVLCFSLGMLFPVLGLLVGAIIGKERGFLYALYGNLVDGAIGLVLWLVFDVLLAVW